QFNRTRLSHERGLRQMLVLTSNPLMLAGFFGGWEMVLILAVVLILVGAKRLPGVGKGLGEGFRRFRKELDDQAYGAGESLGGIYGKPAAEALTPDNQTSELYDPVVFQDKYSGRGKRWFRRLLTFWRLVLRSVLKRLKAKR